MKTVIENLHRLTYLNDGQKQSLESKAQAHLRYSNISFTVMKVTDTELIVQTAQLKHLSENYADTDKLVKVTESVFSPMLYGRKLKVGAKPYVPAPADVVTFDWIKKEMAQQRIKAVELETSLGIDKSTLSLLISGKRDMTRAMKSMFYYYFEYNKLTKGRNESKVVLPESLIEPKSIYKRVISRYGKVIKPKATFIITFNDGENQFINQNKSEYVIIQDKKDVGKDLFSDLQGFLKKEVKDFEIEMLELQE